MNALEEGGAHSVYRWACSGTGTFMTNNPDRVSDGVVAGVTAEPSDNTTLTEVLAGYEASGFDASFSVIVGGIVECNSCGSTLAARRYTIHSLRRLEGASDPDDMIAVVAVTCPVCSAQGVIVLGFGPMASAEDSDVLKCLQDGRGQEELAPDASPADSDEPADPASKTDAMRSADIANGEQP